MVGFARRLRTLCLLAVPIWGVATNAHAAEIIVLCSQGLRTALDELIPQFERASGDSLVITYDTSAILKAQVEAGNGLPPERWSSVRYGFEPCGGCHHRTEEAYG